jgi:uncharacterized Ntn-hydrolase superfamily protein
MNLIPEHSRLSTLVVAFLVTLSFAAKSSAREPMAHTYSIVAYDSVTGQFGAAVQSHWFRVADVIWVEPEVGAVATQSLVDFSYGPLGLDMMRNGKSASDALKGLLASDSNNAVRQVAMIDRQGRVVAHTGSKCIAEAGHRVGRYFSVQANLMLKNTVWDAMAKAFESTKGDLAERMMAALEAAQAEGGDIRGKQSAALAVTSPKKTGQVWTERVIDIRVDDSPEPLVELRRLLNVTRTYDYMNQGDNFIVAKKLDSAAWAYGKAQSMQPENPEIGFWYAVSLLDQKQNDAAMPVFARVFKQDPIWRELVGRCVKAGLIADDKEMLARILKQ